MNAPREEKLEQVVNKVLRGLPLRRAPGTLESRVLAELRYRATLAWWRRSFKYWPLAARGAFVAMNIALVGVTFLNGISGVVGEGSFTEFAAMVMMWLRPFLAAWSSVGDLTPALMRSIPQGWLYIGVVAGAVLYAVLFGLGAAAYRTLYMPPSLTGERP